MAFYVVTILSIFLSFSIVLGLQVTPNSPCASACLDSDSLDKSDPNSSNTKNSDIACLDVSSGSTKSGFKWKNCMSCLQNSTFSQGTENDQLWFLYNSRYALSYCVFGFPNATDVSQSPCVTSAACGPLRDALQDGIPDPRGSSQYGYCSVDEGVMTGEGYSQCLACISATGETQFISNYLVALEAGCQQRPSPGHVIGLNDTVFSKTIVGIVDPAAITAQPNKTGRNGHLSTPTLTGIAVSAAVVLLFLAALLYIRQRRRKNRLARSAAAKAHLDGMGPQSPLSFQCRTHIGRGLASPRFFTSDESGGPSYSSFPSDPKEGSPRSTSLACGPAPVAWQPQNGGLMSSYQDMSISEYVPVQSTNKIPPSKSSQLWDDASKKGGGSNGKSGTNSSNNRPLYSIDTSVLPSAPSVSYHPGINYSPPSAGAHLSPSDTFTTPTSTTSTHSTTQLLPARQIPPQSYATRLAPYSPADYDATTGPHITSLVTPAPPPPRSPATSTTPKRAEKRKGEGTVGIGLGLWTGDGGARRGTREAGSPNETRRIDTVFPPPPPRPVR
ncbi:hypothetical protein VTK73DRAFT_8178 [Phialemonium thermophilum]|uniref:LPXTG-domain-containing protein n=1 Tax=Phialemonium thermophilum TaxID=223376 RepID=A0ABR3XQ50_9PEZI